MQLSRLTPRKVVRLLLTLSGLGLVIAAYLFSAGSTDRAQVLLLSSLVLTGLAFYLHPSLRGYLYTLMILTAATLALLYPSPFVSYQGYPLSQLIIPLLQFIMFGMGSSMTVKDFAAVIKMPKGVFVGLACQLTIMPLSGLLIALWAGLPTEIAAGVILVGCSPSGVASNVISFLARANLALSITITALSTLLAPLTTPFLMSWLAGSFIEINVWDMVWSILKLVLFPIAGGLLFNRLLHDRARWLQRIMPTASMLVIAMVIVLITASGRDNLLEIGALLVFVVLVHNLLGYNLGYWAARLSGLDERDSRTIALEVGLQNGGMAGGLAKEMGKLATLGLAPAVFSVLQNITGSILASFWHKHPPSARD
ncbi:bile acid:sodium symporter family protein [Cyclobacterium xiamenense]|uniref:bile acid:sodium symporter family protein n=1 Tax=Cyclobacterium xiamenense TaxID=1297121 RepID=UPI0035D06D1E